MNGLYVSEIVEKSIIRVDQDTPDKYERLRKEVNISKSSDTCNEIPNALLFIVKCERYI